MIINCKESHISVNSLMGQLNMNRHLLHCRRCNEGYAPFDKMLEINEDHKVTKGLTDAVCDFAQRMSSFKEASYMLEKYLGIKISASMIQAISEEVGEKLFKKDQKEAKYLYENQHKAVGQVPENKKKGRIYIEADGSMLHIRGEGWKEIKLGMVFKDDKILNKDKERHIITDKDYVGFFGSAEEFKKMLFAAAVKNGFMDVKEVVILGDGAAWIWNMANELFPDAVFILDYYHFEEHVYECANIVHPDDEVNKKRFAKEIIDGFMSGKIDDTIGNLKPEEYSNKVVSDKVGELKTYLKNNMDKMNYTDFKDKGYFIGSGAIEGGQKHVLQQRLKLAGMRWSKGGAQYIASLRCADKSSKWSKVTDIIYEKAC